MVNERMKGLGTERSAIRELFEYGNARAKDIGREKVFDFSLGNPNVPAPQKVKEEILRLLEEVPAETLHGYTSAPGDFSVRRSVAEFLTKESGVNVPAELVYMTCGAAASLTATLHALCNEGDEFVAIAPYFPEYKVFAEGAGGTLVSARAKDDFHLDIDELDRVIGKRTKAVLLNSPNNPTGVVYGAEEWTALSALLARKSEEKGEAIYLISDEPYRELTYGAAVPYPMAFYPNTVVCYSFSKSLSLAGERIGYVAVSPRAQNAEDVFAAICGAGRSLGFVCAPALFQRVAAACLGLTSDQSVYKTNRDLLYGALTSYGFSCVEPQGAFYLFVKSPLPTAEFCKKAREKELLLVPSDSFGIEGYVRISYCVSTEMIERSLPAFEALAKEIFV